jgi:hypothetical protein
MRTHESTPEYRKSLIRTLWFTLRQMSAPWAAAQLDTSILPLWLTCAAVILHGDTVPGSGKA